MSVGAVLFVGAPLCQYLAAAALQSRDGDAAEFWTCWAERFPGASAESRFLRARLQRYAGEFDLMLESLRAAVDAGLDPVRADREQTLAAAQTGDLTTAGPQLRQMLLDQQGDGQAICEAFVNGYLIHSRFDDARVLLDGWKSTYPEDPLAYYMQGRIHEYLRQPEQAMESYRESLEQKSDFPPAAYALGRLQLADNRPVDAQSAFERCSGCPHPEVFQLGRARALAAQGNNDQAREILRELADVPTSQLKESFQSVNEQMQGLPVHVELGQMELAEGRFDRAFDLLDAAHKADVRELSVRYSRAVALRGIGRKEEAAAELQEVSRIRQLMREVDLLTDEVRPDTPAIEKRYRIGELYFDYQSKDLGAYWMKSILTFDPDYKPAHARLADYYEERAATDPAWKKFAEQHRRQAQP